MAVETPLINGREVLEKYVGILEKLFDAISEKLTDASDENSQIPEKYRPKFRELAKLMSTDLNGDKNAFINHVKSVVFPEAEAKSKARLGFEENLAKAATSDAKLAEWQRYINFEIS